ncbi:hypothetical protein ACFVYT_24755 [Streptomyces sp. NPDC058290]|uniref:hypothetical protein n=1 Tax=Streptomyces sp. NPDC058290 TaxID=3346426 RepID=UPI0036EB7C89
MPETRLTCLNPNHAHAVVLAARSDSDTTRTIRQDGAQVVIGYQGDIRWPVDVTEWALKSGHIHDDEADRVIASLAAIAA